MRPLRAITLLSFSWLLIAAATLELAPVPSPDLAGLEPAVAEQITAARELLAAGLENPDPKPPEIAELYGQLGQVYQTYDFPEAAAVCYQNAHRLAPREFRWVYGLALLARAGGRLEETATHLQTALAIDPASLAARVTLGEVRLEQNHPDEAEAELRRAIALAPLDAAARAALGQVELSRQRWDAAIEQLELAAALAPAADRLHYPLALAHRGKGDLEKARELGARAGQVGVRPPDPFRDQLEALQTGEVVHLLRGRNAFRAGRYDDAATAFRQALEASPTSVRARVNLATALARQGDLEAATKLYHEVLEREPGNAAAHFNLGTMREGENKYAEAIPHFEAALASDPRDVAARVELGRSLRAVGRQPDALARYRETIEIDPANEDARLGEAAVLVDLGRYREARDRLEAALALMPQQGRLAHALARLLAASPDLAVRDGARAVALAQVVLDAAPSTVHAETLALALAEAGRCQDAADVLRQVLAALAASADAKTLAELSEKVRRLEQGAPCRPEVG